MSKRKSKKENQGLFASRVASITIERLEDDIDLEISEWEFENICEDLGDYNEQTGEIESEFNLSGCYRLSEKMLRAAKKAIKAEVKKEMTKQRAARAKS